MATERQIDRFLDMAARGSMIPKMRLMAADVLRKYGFQPEAVSTNKATQTTREWLDYLIKSPFYHVPGELAELFADGVLSSTEVGAIKNAAFQTFTWFGDRPYEFDIDMPSRDELREQYIETLAVFRGRARGAHPSLGNMLTMNQLRYIMNMTINGTQLPRELVTLAMRGILNVHEASQLLDMGKILQHTEHIPA